MTPRGPHPIEWLRGVALSLERLAAQGVASGAVRGAAEERRALEEWSRSAAQGAARGVVEELRRLVPNLQPTTQDILGRARLWLERSESEAVARAHALRAPDELARAAVAGAVAGASEQLSALLPTLAAPAAEVAARIGSGLVRGGAEELARQLRAAARNPAARAVALGIAAIWMLRAARKR
jgi:hypothetical protein